MDLFVIIGKILSSFWFLIPIIIIGVLIKTPWFKGAWGEFIVNFSFKVFLNSQEYHLIRNVTIPTNNGTTQIDHIIVSQYGIFVVETKNMKGWIFGNAEQKMWVQKIYKHSSQFQNPLHQNFKHIRSLQYLLGLTDEVMHSLIIFIGNSKFKTAMPDNVTQGLGYLKYIKSKKEIILPSSRVNELVKKIEAERLTRSFKTHREHVKHVKEIIREKESHMVCQKCGSPMVKRRATKGAKQGNIFWGCSEYPKCRNIINIT